MKPKDYLEFEEVLSILPNRKTKTWFVKNAVSGEVLAAIAWRPGWRRYIVRFGGSKTVEFDSGCLKELETFLENQMHMYKYHKDEAKKNGKAKTTSRSKTSQRVRVQRKIS